MNDNSSYRCYAAAIDNPALSVRFLASNTRFVPKKMPPWQMTLKTSPKPSVHLYERLGAINHNRRNVLSPLARPIDSHLAAVLKIPCVCNYFEN